ncbi:MAG: DUF1080 domain-containing protein [Acidobacteriota bacterium]
MRLRSPQHRCQSILAAATLCLLLATSELKAEDKPLPLFDGRTFENWEGDTEKSFRIEDGAIVGGTVQAAIPRNEFLCTRRSFGNFVLRLKFRLVGDKTNAGVQFRSRRIPNHHEVSGYQADLGNPGWWGCLYDESRRNQVLAQSDMAALRKTLRTDDWNDYRIQVEGRRIRLFINGVETIDYTEKDESIEQNGVLCLQIHGGPPGEAWYKDISIQELP